MIVYKKCPICEKEEFDYVLSAKDRNSLEKMKFNVLKCRFCNLEITHLPSDIDASKFYPEYYREFKKGISGFSRTLFLNYYRIFYSIRWLKKGMKILDAGCGNGLFASFLESRGCHVYCMEGNTASVKTASSVFNLKATKADLTSLPYKDLTFDVVILRHSLEHSLEINEVMKDSKRILKPDGFIYIECPNAKSIEKKIFGPNWYHLDLPRHACHFSPESIIKLVKKYGFGVISTKHDNFMPHSYGMSVVYFIEDLIKFRLPCIIRKIIVMALYPLSVLINIVFSIFGKGSISRLLAVKGTKL
jgi:2-polyprenyl-3-methyl-5-hydroxy-6-metoxy-1,4-benzoquinol methylase